MSIQLIQHYYSNDDKLIRYRGTRNETSLCKAFQEMLDHFTRSKNLMLVQEWEYRLGTYSALEWILERYKEKNPKGSTFAEKFSTYRFADHKERVIDVLLWVCTVSVETMRFVKEMP